MKLEMSRIASKSDFEIDTLEIDKDHIHILIDSIPSLSITSIVRRLKQESIISIWENFQSTLRKHFW